MEHLDTTEWKTHQVISSLTATHRAAPLTHTRTHTQTLKESQIQNALLFMRYWELLLGVSVVTTWSACTDTHARTHTRRLIIYEQGHRDARAGLVWGLNPSNGGGESVRETLRLHGDEITGMKLEEGVSNAAVGKWNTDALVTSKHQGNDGPFSGCCCALPEVWFTAKNLFYKLPWIRMILLRNCRQIVMLFWTT